MQTPPAPPYAKSAPVFPPPIRTSVPWSTGLCHFSDGSLWCITCFLPCITFGRIAEIVDGGSSSCMTHALLYAAVNYLTGCVCVYSGFYREKIRQRYGLENSPCNDYCVHCCCHSCALQQEYREDGKKTFNEKLENQYWFSQHRPCKSECIVDGSWKCLRHETSEDE